MVSVDADNRTLEVDAEGADEAGVHLSDLVKPEGGAEVVEGSARVATGLSRFGWKVNFYAGGKDSESGSGVSRPTKGIEVNPLELRKPLKAIKG
ncbi:MAG: hypothetical protein JRM95_04985 [Nitrososphaerota archaeon]|nr:hypothetical protein [Nitrososphaerota archaeon]